MGYPEQKGLTLHTVKTSSCGELKVYSEGNLEHAQKEEICAFLTVHDMGSNYESMVEFTHQPCMEGMRQRAVFLHVVVPGQEEGAQDLNPEFHFPSMQELGETLVDVLDQLNLKYVLGLGEGAGANIITRFGMKHPTRCLGIVLIHPTSTTAGVMEHFKDKIIAWKLTTVGHNPTAEEYLVFHKFGQGVEAAKDKVKAMEEFRETLHTQINPSDSVNEKKLSNDVTSLTFGLQTWDLNLSTHLEQELKCDTLLVVGSKSSFLHTTETMYSHSNPTKTSILRIDDVGDVLDEAPEKVSQSILLFSQGLGLFTSLGLGGNRSRSGSMIPHDRRPSKSMEQYDQPNVKRFVHDLVPGENQQ
ncbi:uncharacterized protein ZK1073.1 [Eurytemora carolleeae]|uniref:uncharacterized protein ZK1073.1 n=1 Tax=Eurytemora carolleeae TaxID=1294199 RepID=UPI000C784EA7|nr:uncharacterized protein ZK1073.1 [Eurytemora carolleeae]|eukprot:XP_023333500.1 uncharacterized protein ZK1073.1-like [Eurytemora affinis]